MGLLLSLTLAIPGVASAEATPPFIPKDASWLTTVNYFRQMAGLGPVVEDATLSDGAYKHSCYMLQNDITHYEEAGKPGYTTEGERAGRSGNVAVSSAFNTGARSHIELWMSGPFHAIGVLRKDLVSVGFGKCDMPAAARWRSGATLDILNGLGPKTAMAEPILFPGNGSTTSLDRFVVESPDPLEFCGWKGQTAGLPVFAMMPEALSGAVTTSMTGPAGPVATCTLSQQNTTGAAKQILAFDNVIVAVPRTTLTPGTYTVTAGSASRTVSWSFTVDPAAANGVSPAPTASPTGGAVGFQPITPTRLVDTRDRLGATRLAAGVTKRIQITGGVVPTGASAISANFTVVGPEAAGYLTVWDCAATQPTVSTVNFVAGETAPNLASIPLDASGGLCVIANTGTDLVIDVNGYFGTTGSSRYTPVTPARLMDTRDGTGGSGRLAAGQTATLQVGGVAGVPAGIQAVSLNVTSVDPGAAGYVTVYACGGQRPVVSNLNPQPGRVRPNLVVVPVSADGKVCLFSLQDVELVVDVTGYFSSTSTNRFTASTPFRMVDTRDVSRAEVNVGTGGNQLGKGQVLQIQVAGQRGVPSSAKAVSLNLTVTGATAPGFITAWPCGDRPLASTANYGAGDAVSNGAQLPLSSTGALCIYSNQAVHVILDVNGWWS
jgi:hypothetical protein